MKTVIFVGPTLPAEEIKELLPEATVFGPATQGDVDFAATLGFQVIGLIDGVHTQKLPVWHKEILHVLANGSRLIGAGSMGALRAVECEPWGSEPLGEVARWFQEGMIEADDEVCVSHLGKAQGYRQMSLPLVNVRATLKAAQVETQRAQEIIAAAQEIFYADRTWPRLFDLCESDYIERSQILDCELDIKAADALHLCYYIQNLPTNSASNGSKLVAKNAGQGYGGVFLKNDRKIWTGSKVVRQHELAQPAFRDAALNRALALEYCKMVGLSETAPEIDIKAADDLSPKEFKQLRDEEATLARAREWYSNAASGFEDVPQVLNMMRVTGAYSKAKQLAK